MRPLVLACSAVAFAALGAAPVHADVVLDANARAAELVSTVRPTPVAVRGMAVVQVSVFDAVQSIAGRYPPLVVKETASRDASLDAAVAAATRGALLAVAPAQKDAIEKDYAATLAAIPDGPAKTSGVAAGERAAAEVVAACARDGADAQASYVPHAAAGVYVPTTLPAVPHWGRRKTWVLGSGDALRPAAPPTLTSATWKRDLAESAALGGRTSTTRTPEQTAIARFWEASGPVIYWPIARGVAKDLGYDAVESARLLAEAAIAMDDAIIAVFDAKYAYGFWRPVTAVRNASRGVGDPQWEPLIETPMHPEYPCAHCIASASLGTVLQRAIGDRPSPVLRTTSPTAGGAERSWPDAEAFMREVSEARICAGVHYRNSTEVGNAMGRKIGAMAGSKFPKAAAGKAQESSR